MSPSSHSFTCEMITATSSILNFIFDNPKGGWMLVGVSAIIFIIAAVFYKKERRTRNDT